MKTISRLDPVTRTGAVYCGPTCPKLGVRTVRLIDFKAKTPLIGMSMVFLAMGIVAVTAYLHVGWYSAV